MSQVGAAETSSDEPKSQISPADMSTEKERSQAAATYEACSEPELHTSSTDKCSSAIPTDEHFGEEKEHVTARNEPESQTGTADMSGKEEASPATIADSYSAPEPQTGTADMSSKEEASPATTTDSYTAPESQTGTADMSGKEEALPASTTDSYSEPGSQTSTTDMSSKEEALPATTTDSYTAPESQTGTADMSGKEEALPASTTDSYSVPESQTGTADMSGKEGALPASTTDSYRAPESQTGTTDMSGKEEALPASTTDFYSAPESQTGTADISGNVETPPASTAYSSGEPESQVSTTSKYFANEKPQVKTTEKYTGKPQSPASTTNKAFGEEKSQESVTDKASGEPWSQMAAKDKPDEQLSEWSSRNESLGGPDAETGTAVMPGGLQSQDTFSDKETLQEDVTDKVSSHPKSHTRVTDIRFGQDEPHVYAIKKRLGESTADKSRQAEPQGDKYSSKGESEKKDAGKQEVNTSELRHRQLAHSSTEPESSLMSGTLESRTTGKSSGERVSQMGATDKLGERETQTSITIEEKLPTRYWVIGGFTVLVVVALVYFLYPWKGQPPAHKESKLEIFFKEVANLKKDFPGQYEGLWFRSEKILHKHLNASHPSAPSILILTAAQDGERTLQCVSKRLAQSYANSLRANWLVVHGPSKSKYDGATSKMQIDNELSSAFQSNSRAAVLYRLETLPPGSLLILYKYCDHENAAFKDVALVITILLEEESLEKDLSFTEVEEKVKDLLWERFASSEVGAHHEMDVDKLSGVWSRISHIVLPVLPVRSVESGRCPGITD